MDPNNNENEDALDESDFTEVSSVVIGMNSLEITDLEEMVKKNGDQSSSTMQVGEKIGKIENKLDEMKKENEDLKDGMTKMMKAFDELKAANVKEELAGKHAKFEWKIMKFVMTEQIDGNQWLKYDRNAYKLNVMGGKKSTISEGGLAVAKHSGPRGWNCFLTSLPIPKFDLKGIIDKPTISFYFEVEIIKRSCYLGGTCIGFCDRQFPLEGKELGKMEHSIGFYNRRIIEIDGAMESRLEYGWNGNFMEDDVVGLGIIHQPNSKMECFATINGKFLGKAELLPAIFANLELFPAVGLYDADDSIRLNFGKEEWKFKEFTRVLEYEIEK